jgi:hypothetical protein
VDGDGDVPMTELLGSTPGKFMLDEYNSLDSTSSPGECYEIEICFGAVSHTVMQGTAFGERSLIESIVI